MKLVLGLVWADSKREVWKMKEKMMIVKGEELVCVLKKRWTQEGDGWRQKGWS